MDILFSVIKHSTRLSQVPKSNHDQRREVLISELFNSSFDRVSSGLFSEDQNLFALRLAQIRLQRDENFLRLFDVLLKPVSALKTKLPTEFLGGRLSKQQLIQLEELENVTEFANIISDISMDEPRWI